VTLELHDPQGQLLDELTLAGITQQSVAITYAFAIAQLGDAGDWLKINRAIQARWKGKTALLRIKTEAWRIVDRWRGEKHSEI